MTSSWAMAPAMSPQMAANSPTRASTTSMTTRGCWQWPVRGVIATAPSSTSPPPPALTSTATMWERPARFALLRQLLTHPAIPPAATSRSPACPAHDSLCRRVWQVVFGRVLTGMEVVYQMAEVPQRSRPTHPPSKQLRGLCARDGPLLPWGCAGGNGRELQAFEGHTHREMRTGKHLAAQS